MSSRKRRRTSPDKASSQQHGLPFLWTRARARRTKTCWVRMLYLNRSGPRLCRRQLAAQTYSRLCEEHSHELSIGGSAVCVFSSGLRGPCRAGGTRRTARTAGGPRGDGRNGTAGSGWANWPRYTSVDTRDNYHQWRGVLFTSYGCRDNQQPARDHLLPCGRGQRFSCSTMDFH